MARLWALAGALMVCACASVEPSPPPPMVTAFDPAEMEWAKAPGPNRIRGDGFLRTRGGDVKTCAGLDVWLVPVSNYTAEWASRNYDGQNGGYKPKLMSLNPYPSLSQAATQYVLAKKCDAQGRFAFESLADGAYYVVATVTWEAPSQYGLETQGGELAQRVDVAGGETKTITLAR